MNEDSINLLKECNAGCKSATNSMEQVEPFINNEELRSVIDKYNDKHIKIGDECHEMLNEMGEDEKDPHAIAKVFSWVSTEVKLMVNDDSSKIAQLMVDGCNMGIKSVSKYINQYKDTSKEIMSLAKNLVKIEQEFMDDLLVFIH